jgi:hypothetical protein
MIVNIKSFLVLSGSAVLVCQAFSPVVTKGQSGGGANFVWAAAATDDDIGTYPQIDERSGKATGVSFLPKETIERAKDGSPVEKIKLERDGTSAFVDVYEYARKIRAGEMTWEDVEKTDLDTVRLTVAEAKESRNKLKAWDSPCSIAWLACMDTSTHFFVVLYVYDTPRPHSHLFPTSVAP